MASLLNPIARHRARCREVRSQMSEYLDGELDSPAASRIERHARWCRSCARILTNLSRTIQGLRALGDLD